MWKNNNKQRGQSLVEVIVALGIFAIVGFSIVFLAVDSYTTVRQGGELTRAVVLAGEGIDAARSILNSSFNELPVGGVYGLDNTEGYWRLYGDEDVIDQFRRTLSVEEVYRDSAGDITESGETLDLYIKKIISTVSWDFLSGRSNLVEVVSYLSDWESRYWTQTDWSGGAGQEFWSDATGYFSDDGNIDNSDAGEIKLARQNYSWISNESTINQNLNDIFPVSSSDIWAVGGSGKILHYDGSAWSEFTDIGAQSLNSVYMLSSTDGWAVGGSGKILHYDGSAWNEFVDLGGTTLNSVYMLSSTDGWAVGGSGKILHYDGSAWNEFVDLGGTTLNSVYMLSSTGGWVVGNAGKIYYYDGLSWNEQISPVNRNLFSVSMISASEGWISGANGVILNLYADYATSGYLESSAFDIGSAGNFNIIEWDEILPNANFDVKLQIKTAPDVGGSSGTWTATWSGPEGDDGDETDYFTDSPGHYISTDHNGDQWIKYKAFLTGDGTGTPALREIRIDYTP